MSVKVKQLPLFKIKREWLESKGQPAICEVLTWWNGKRQVLSVHIIKGG